MARRAAYLDEVWSSGRPILSLDAGGLFGQRTRMDREQTRFLCEVCGEFGLDAVGLGMKDLNYGVDFLREMIDTYGLPFTSANVRFADSGELVVPEYLLIERGGITFGVVSVMDHDAVISTMAAREESFRVDDPVPVLRTLLPRVREAGAKTVIVIAHLGDTKAEQLIHDVKGIDVCLVGDSRRPYRTERLVDDTALIAASYEGRYIGRLDADIDPVSGKLQAFQVAVTELGDGSPEDAVMLERVEGFLAKLEEFRMAARGPYQPTKGSEKEQFLSDRECRKCHMDVWDKLRESPHQAAFTTLARKGQAQSPECLVCHTTGYLYKGGYDDRPPANRLKNVQCEACHGYGTEHARDGEWAAKARASCLECHDAENSPDFDYETYWAKIAH